MRFIAAILATLVLVACGASGHHQHKKLTYTERVKEYRVEQPDNTWIYWYFLYSDSSNGSSRVYYYSSPTQITNYSSVNFTRAINGLPQEAKDAEAKGEEVGEQNITEQEAPQDVQQDDAAQQAAYSEYEATQGEIDSQSTSTESTSSESTSSDSGGSSDGGSSD